MTHISRFLSLKTTASMVLFLMIAMIPGGCAHMATLTSMQKTTNADGSAAQPASKFAQFPDLPFPPGSKMDIEKTFIVGSDEGWYGQTAVTTKLGANGTFDFYKQQLKEYNWQELSSVRAQTSILTYTRDHRVLAIQLVPGSLSTTEILVTVSPRDNTDATTP